MQIRDAVSSVIIAGREPERPPQSRTSRRKNKSLKKKSKKPGVGAALSASQCQWIRYYAETEPLLPAGRRAAASADWKRT